jgi:hypothetical protein
VEQQHDRGIWVAGRPIEDADSIGFNLVDGRDRHGRSGTQRPMG